jgi:hypothetical protein
MQSVLLINTYSGICCYIQLEIKCHTTYRQKLNGLKTILTFLAERTYWFLFRTANGNTRLMTCLTSQSYFDLKFA